MSFQTHINIDALLRKVANAEVGKLQFANKVLHDSNKFVPVDTGALKGSGHVEAPSKVVWDASNEQGHAYAGYVYNMPESNNFTHAGTTSHWFEHAKAEKLDEWKRFAKEVVGSGSTGFDVSTGD